jgi:hypothetical protein
MRTLLTFNCRLWSLSKEYFSSPAKSQQGGHGPLKMTIEQNSLRSLVPFHVPSFDKEVAQNTFLTGKVYFLSRRYPVAHLMRLECRKPYSNPKYEVYEPRTPAKGHIEAVSEVQRYA